MTVEEKNAAANHFGTWNKSSTSRATILPDGITRCTSMSTVDRQADSPPTNSKDPNLLESSIKQKLSANPKYHSIPIHRLPSSDVDKSRFCAPTLEQSDISLQKPRVYLHEDRSAGRTHPNVLPSTSNSSMSSNKVQSFQERILSRYALDCSLALPCLAVTDARRCRMVVTSLAALAE